MTFLAVQWQQQENTKNQLKKKKHTWREYSGKCEEGISRDPFIISIHKQDSCHQCLLLGILHVQLTLDTIAYLYIFIMTETT